MEENTENNMTWIRVKDRLPEDNNLVLCWNPHIDYPSIGGMRVEMGAPPGYSINFAYRTNVTHWMPLPNPPEEP